MKRPASDDTASGVRAAEIARQQLVELRRAFVDGDSADDLRATGDRQAHEKISSILQIAYPDDAILSEEAADDPRRLIADRVWIIDPLDGTREFGERDPLGAWRDDFAVHVALWERGHGLTLGVVALPARNVVFCSDDPPAVPPRSNRKLRIAVSRTRPPDFIAALGTSGTAELVPMGSAGVKVMAVVSGEVDAYIHAGGQYQWDSAAPVAIAHAAGLVATRIDGSPLEYNVPELLLPDLVVCHPDRASEVGAILSAAGFGARGAHGASAAESSR